MIYTVLYKNNIGGGGIDCDVLCCRSRYCTQKSKKQAYKIVKIDSIALQCKSMITKYIYTEYSLYRNGGRIGAHEVVSSGGYAETYQADGVPHRRVNIVSLKC